MTNMQILPTAATARAIAPYFLGLKNLSSQATARYTWNGMDITEYVLSGVLPEWVNERFAPIEARTRICGA